MSKPTVAELAAEIKGFADDLTTYDPEDLMEPGDEEPWGECRLQVVDGTWYFHTGSPDYDQDHRGKWACASVRPGASKKACLETARDMLEDLE